MVEESLSYFDAIKDDPVSLLKLLNKYVKVQLILNTSFEGFIRSIDPISHSIILSVPKEGVYQTTLIPGCQITSVTETPTELEPPTLRNTVEIQDQVSSDHKNKLINWFKKNLLTVSEEGDKIVVGGVCLMPPYSLMDIYADNAVILTQIRKLIEQMPVDFVS